MPIFDTDILIWLQRGNEKAATLIDNTNERAISIITLMELLQCAPSKLFHKQIRGFLLDYNFKVLPLTENIGHRASIYIEEYSLGAGIRVGDALIAATTVESNQELISGNKKHYHLITELNLQVFTPI